jgi:Tfp pilus assembly protein PilO
VISRWRAWQSLLPVWLSAVILCLASVGWYGWLSSESLGLEAQLDRGVEDLRENLKRLGGVHQNAADERHQVIVLEEELVRLYDEVFGSLDARLTDILRAVGSATREAGLLPGRYSYSADEDEELELIRFGIQFTVTGEYEQVRRMLSALQASPEFLVVDHISFTGEETATTHDLRIAVKLATYVADADRAKLELLVGQPEALGGDDG